MTAKLEMSPLMPARPAAAAHRNTDVMRQFALKNIVWIWLIGLVIAFSALNSFFWSAANLQNTLTQATVLGLLALAASLPLLVGEIDLSLAANMGISSAVGGLLMGAGWSAPACIGTGLLVSTTIGFINGLCITKLRMVSLIETLSMMIILQGGLLALTRGTTITHFSASYLWIGQTTIGGWPILPVALFVAFVLMAVLLRRTVFGRQLYATGGNAAAAHVAGIRVAHVKILAYTLAGFIAGLAGYFLASWQMAITSDQGAGFLLYAIAAPIIGGVSVFGGRGNTLGILGGVLLLTVIHVGLAIVNVPSFYVEMIGGVLIFVAVAVDALRVGGNTR